MWLSGSASPNLSHLMLFETTSRLLHAIYSAFLDLAGFCIFSDHPVQIFIRWSDVQKIRRDLWLKKGVSIRQLWRRRDMQIFFFLSRAIFAENKFDVILRLCGFRDFHMSNPCTTKKRPASLPLHWRVPWAKMATVIVALWNLPNGWPGPELTNGRTDGKYLIRFWNLFLYSDFSCPIFFLFYCIPSMFFST